MKNMIKKHRVSMAKAIFGIGMFLLFFCFSYSCHPQVVLDYDDWSYIAYTRIPIPWPTFWNPSRVLPEILMPLSGFLGAAINKVFPKLQYIKAQTAGTAFVLSSLEVFYFMSLLRLLMRRRGNSLKIAAGLTAVFCLLHFLAFRTSAIGNSYLFQSANLTCCYFYLIPALLNAGMSNMLLSSEKETLSFMPGKERFRTAIIFCGLYFSLFSNLYASILLSSFAGWDLLSHIRRGKGRQELRSFAKEHEIPILILLFFSIAVIFEAFGGRAKLTYQTEQNYWQNLAETFMLFIQTLKSCNWLFSLIIVFGIIAEIGICLYQRHSEEARLLCLCGITVVVFVLLLCAKVSPSYITRPEVLISVFFYIFLLAMDGFAAFLQKFPRSGRLLPLLILIVAVAVNPPGRTFGESYSIDCEITPETCIAVSQDVVDQVVSAVEAGETEAEIEVMFTGEYGSENWPQVTYMADALQKALVRHGVIDHAISLEIVPSTEFNEKYGLHFALVEGNS